MTEKYHPALERTSPKGSGSTSIGRCRLCGQTGLTYADMVEDGKEPCTPSVDRDRLVIDAIDGGQS